MSSSTACSPRPPVRSRVSTVVSMLVIGHFPSLREPPGRDGPAAWMRRAGPYGVVQDTRTEENGARSGGYRALKRAITSPCPLSGR